MNAKALYVTLQKIVEAGRGDLLVTFEESETDAGHLISTVHVGDNFVVLKSE